VIEPWKQLESLRQSLDALTALLDAVRLEIP
jgi:hypothetical protein